jgi:hypothetical protein
VETLIGLIHDSVLDETLSLAAIDEMRRILGATAGWFMAPSPGGVTFETRIGISAQDADTYARDFHFIDPLFQAHLASPAGSTNIAVRNTDLIAEAEWTGSAVYRTLCAPANLGHLLTTMLDPGEGAPVRVLTFARPPQAPPFTDQDRAIYQTAIPHLLRASRLRHATARRLVAAKVGLHQSAAGPPRLIQPLSPIAPAVISSWPGAALPHG